MKQESEFYEVYCITPTWAALLTVRKNKKSERLKKEVTQRNVEMSEAAEEGFKYLSEHFRAGEHVSILGTKVTGTLIKYFEPTGYWTIKTDSGFSVEYEHQPENKLKKL